MPHDIAAFERDHTPSPEMRRVADEVMLLGRLSVAFARIERVPRYPDGRRETDVEHSFMLAFIAPLLAEKYLPQLDLGLVSRFAIIHDLVEVYADDTATLNIDAEGLRQKAEREAQALERLRDELGGCMPGLIELIERYESLDTQEARFVKVMDKVMPAITHFFTNGSTLREDYGYDGWDAMYPDIARATERVAGVAPDQTFALELRNAMNAIARDEIWNERS